MVMDRLLRAFELAEDGRGRRAYVAWLEARASENGGRSTTRHRPRCSGVGILGRRGFKDKLLAMVKRAMRGDPPRKARTAVASAHGEREAERLIREVGKVLELPTDMRELMSLRKSDGRKVILAAMLRNSALGGVRRSPNRLHRRVVLMKPLVLGQ